MRKFLGVIFAAGLAVFLLAACGGNDNGATDQKGGSKNNDAADDAGNKLQVVSSLQLSRIWSGNWRG